MKKVLVLQHQNKMNFSRELLQMQLPLDLKILLYTVVLFFLTFILIVLFGKIDDVVKVTGIVRTAQNVSSVKNVIAGKIKEKNYLPGQKINEGELLYKIDSSVYDIESENLESERQLLEEKVNGLEEILKSYREHKNLVSKENKASYSRFENYLKTWGKYDYQKKIAYKAWNDENTLPEGLKIPSNIEQKKLEYEYYKKLLESYESEFVSNLNSEKVELELSYEVCKNKIEKLNKEYDYLQVRAPLDGFVQETSSLNIGDYVESGKTVLNIVPDDSANFRIEMQVFPKDMGKIKEGMKVKFRLSAFPYFEYKGAEGKIISVDPDIRTGESGALFYCVYADIDRTKFSSRAGDVFPIRAGLEANCRIVLENNSILFFILKKMNFLME
jgi:membrane fusion protein, peptide pheromone/bacteriocin exporter